MREMKIEDINAVSGGSDFGEAVLTGAGAGAAIGSFVSPVGTAVGALVGAGLGALIYMI